MPETLTIPRWAVWVLTAIASFFVLTFLPWSVWVTASSFTANTSSHLVGDHVKAIDTLEGRLVVIEAKQFTAADGKSLVADLKTDLNDIRSKVENIQRDFDRTIGKGMQ
jgi:hypothetical protein